LNYAKSVKSFTTIPIISGAEQKKNSISKAMTISAIDYASGLKADAQ